MALIQFYAATDNKQLAAEATKAFEGTIRNDSKDDKSVDKNRNGLALAYAYELSGRTTDASTKYAAALETSPEDEELLKKAIEFDLRTGNTTKAEFRLRQIVAKKSVPKESEMIRWARRQLAPILAQKHTYPTNRKAHDLIEANLRDLPDSTADRRRLTTLVAASLPTLESRKLAISEFEKLRKVGGSLTLDDQLLLAKLYLADGNWVMALPIYRDVATHSRDPGQLAVCVEEMLNHKNKDQPDSTEAEAQSWLRKLETIPHAEFAAVILRSELLLRQNRSNEAFEQLVELVKTSRRRCQDGPDPSTIGDRTT